MRGDLWTIEDSGDVAADPLRPKDDHVAEFLVFVEEEDVAEEVHDA